MKLSKVVSLLSVLALALIALTPGIWAQDDGATLFKKCAACHGADAAGKPAMKAPSIKDADEGKIKKTVTTNPKHTSLKGLTDAQIKAIADYIKTLK